jgi:hypothetical protein
MDKKSLNLLYRSFDDTLTPEEERALQKQLKESLELRQEKSRILAIRQGIAGNATASFKPLFAERVINRIRTEESRLVQQQLFFETLLTLFRRVALVGCIVAILLISLNFITGSTGSDMSASTLEEILIPTFSTSLEELL